MSKTRKTVFDPDFVRELYVEEMPWRGIDAFGDDRDWSDIPHPEAKGLARFAVQQSPNAPVDFICEIFMLKRRYGKTLEQFQSWIDEITEPD